MRTNLFALGGVKFLGVLDGSLLLVGSIICSALNSTGAATMTNTWNYDPPLNGWGDQNFTIPRFDPADGTLVRLDIAFSMRADSTVRLTSSCIEPKLVNFGYTNTFTLSGANLSVTGRAGGRSSASVNSGETVIRPNQSVTQSTTNEIFDPKLQVFVGTGSVALTMRRSQNVSVDCGGNDCGCIFPAFGSIDAKIDVAFIYVYEPRPILFVGRSPIEQSALLEWNQSRGFVYVVEKTTNFSDWLPILTNINIPPVAHETIPTHSESRQFFRLRRTQTGTP